MAANKRTKQNKNDDRRFISELYARSVPIREIARRLNDYNKSKEKGYTLHYSSIATDIKKILMQWQSENKEFITRVVDKEIRKLDLIESECWDAWENSKKGKSKSKYKGGNSNTGQLDEFTKESTNGDPKYFDKILQCIDRRKDLLGYGQAKKIELTGSIGVSAVDYTPDELEAEKKRLMLNVINAESRSHKEE